MFVQFDLLMYMDEPYKTFWQAILDYNYHFQKENNIHTNFMYGLNINAGLKIIPDFCPFLTNEAEFNKLKEKINASTIQFKYCNAIKLADTFKKKYDLILLSNILDYAFIYWGSNWQMQKLNDYINILQKMLKKNGIIFLHYIFNNTKCFHQANFYKPYLNFDDEIYNLNNKHQILLVRK